MVCPNFQSTLIKIQDFEAFKLTPYCNKMAVKLVRKEVHGVHLPPFMVALYFADMNLKRHWASPSAKSSKNSDTRSIVTTWNICERFFSVAGFTPNDHREDTLSLNFMSQLFLHGNYFLSDIDNVHRIIDSDMKNFIFNGKVSGNIELFVNKFLLFQNKYKYFNLQNSQRFSGIRSPLNVSS